MTRTRARLASAFGGLMIIALLAFPAGVFANTGEPIAQTGGMSATLPLFGMPLTVDVTLDKTTGNISGVALTPTGDFTASTTKPEIVKYANAAGTTTVSVRAFGSSETVRAKSGALADFLGSGSWSADVFGTSSTSSVAYTIGDDGSGHPTLAFGTITPGTNITDSVTGPTMHSGDRGSWAIGTVKFSYQGYDKRLTIAVGVGKDGKASVKLTLSGRDRQKTTGSLADLAAAGQRTWSAHLCDGTAVAVLYHVVDTAGVGSIAYDSATGGTVTTKSFTGKGFGDKHGSDAKASGLWARFDGTAVGVSVWLRDNGDGTFRLVTRGFSGWCAPAKPDHQLGFGLGHGDKPDGAKTDGFKSNGAKTISFHSNGSRGGWGGH